MKQGAKSPPPIGKRGTGDFLCLNPVLVIEIDGSQHTGLIAYDAERSSFLERRGLQGHASTGTTRVLARNRTWVRESRLGSAAPPNPLPSGGGNNGTLPRRRIYQALYTCCVFVKQGTKLLKLIARRHLQRLKPCRRRQHFQLTASGPLDVLGGSAWISDRDRYLQSPCT